MCYSTNLHSPLLSPSQKWVCHTFPCRTLVGVTAGIRPLIAGGVLHALWSDSNGHGGPSKGVKITHPEDLASQNYMQV